MCLAQEHNTVTLEKPEPAAPLSGVKHFTTEPLCSLPLDARQLLLYPKFREKYITIKKIYHYISL